MNLSLLMDLYELTMAQGYFVYKHDTRATFELFVRNLPKHRNYLVACGLEDILKYVKGLRFSTTDIAYLRGLGLFSSEFLEYLRKFRFRGEIWAMPEGTVFFPGEPVVRVTASLIEAQLLESFLLNAVNLQSTIASKASRVVSAAAGRGCFDFSLRRTQGQDAALKVARSSYIAGFKGTSNVLAGRLYGIPVAGTMAHSFIMAFKEELDSFLAYADIFPAKSVLLVDTYEPVSGIKNAIKIGLYLKERNCRLLGIRLDSGDMVSLSKKARKMLDDAGLSSVKVFASGNLDEYKISQLIRAGACIDNFGVGTRMGVSSDAPFLDVIYKMSEVTGDDGNFNPTMKLSRAKATFPGRKQVYRQSGKGGRFTCDILALPEERVPGQPLLVKVVDRGRVVYKNPPLSRISGHLKRQISGFAPGIMKLEAAFDYPVKPSRGLVKLRDRLFRSLVRRG